MIVCGLEGAMLVARPYGDVARFQSAADCLMAQPEGRRAGRVSKRWDSCARWLIGYQALDSVSGATLSSASACRPPPVRGQD